MPTMEKLEADACVVGAGYAGLTAALRITQAGGSVIVLEARDRVGGRVWTERLRDGTPIDRGGAWLGPGQDRLYALAEETSVGTYPTFVAGDNLLLRGGRSHRYRGLIPGGLGWFALACLGVAMKRIDAMSKSIYLTGTGGGTAVAVADSITGSHDSVALGNPSDENACRWSGPASASAPA
jgi:monoamine oxidase